jgi:hypothetical protein
MATRIFTEAELKWLGGADSTDPIILARMDAALGKVSSAEPTAGAGRMGGDRGQSDAPRTLPPEADDDRSKTSSPTVTPQTTTKKQDKDKPGVRTYNPLSKFSSYTYQITLYMITPDAYNIFNDSGRRNISMLNAQTDNKAGGSFIIAQSGGVSSDNPNDQRAPGFDLDFYIDDLTIRSWITAPSSGSEANTTKIEFTIKEPYGFSFMTSLKKAADAVSSYSKIIGIDTIENATRQIFILGVRFQGYDKDGKALSSKTTFSDDTFTHGDSQGIFERFIDIAITKIAFKIDGMVTTYRCSGVTLQPGTAFGTKRGAITAPGQIVASTLAGALGVKGNAEESHAGVLSLMDVLKANEKANEAKQGTTKGFESNTYEVTFVGNPTHVSDLRNAKMSHSSAIDIIKNAPASNVSKSSDSTAATSTDISKNLVSIKFDAGEPILKIIRKLVINSDYANRALNVISATEKEAVTGPSSKNPSPKDIKWYHVSADVRYKKWDPARNDWVLHTNYVIEPYLTPSITSPYVKVSSESYYGPHKRYDYWFSGENTEIIKFEQVLDNSYYMTVLDTDIEVSPSGPSVQRGRANATQGAGTGVTQEAKNDFWTIIKDPASYTRAKITILGDPDFLMSDSTSGVAELYNLYYGSQSTDFIVNPNGSMVFVEINFSEAKDYNNASGLLDINRSISFWQYSPEIIEKLQLKGVVYKLLQVDSRFVGGKFQQDLLCTIHTFDDATTPATREATKPTENADGRGVSAPAAPATTRTVPKQEISIPGLNLTGVPDAPLYANPESKNRNFDNSGNPILRK